MSNFRTYDLWVVDFFYLHILLFNVHDSAKPGKAEKGVDGEWDGESCCEMIKEREEIMPQKTGE